MPDSLPADPPHARSLTDVMPDALAALDGRSGPLGLSPATSAIVVLVDGLGIQQLRDRSGHARTLAAAAGRKDVVRTVFPSTTAAALTSLTTGTAPGRHGVVGYRVRIPGTDAATNQLTGWEADGIDPATWQPEPTAFERATAAGRPAFVVNKAEYADTGFTRAAFRGAEFIAAASVAERFAAAAAAARANPGALVYTYANELDAAGHRHGVDSDAWLAALEEVESAMGSLTDVADGVGVLVTADHGMVDVPRHAHRLLTHGDDVLDEVDLIAGEPRMLHLYAAPGAEQRVLDRWRAAESSRSWVLSRAELVASGALGPSVTPEAAARLGDVVVAARSRVAYYDDRLADRGPQNMVGQHGSWTPEERIVPLLRFGAFSR